MNSTWRDFSAASAPNGPSARALPPHASVLSADRQTGGMLRPNLSTQRSVPLVRGYCSVVLGQHGPRDQLLNYWYAVVPLALALYWSFTRGLLGCYISGVRCLLSAGYLFWPKGGGVGAVRPSRRYRLPAIKGTSWYES